MAHTIVAKSPEDSNGTVVIRNPQLAGTSVPAGGLLAGFLEVHRPEHVALLDDAQDPGRGLIQDDQVAGVVLVAGPLAAQV